MTRDAVAIVGMGCLFAGSPNLDAYWQNILAKVDGISDPPPNEWDPKLFYDPTSKSNDRVYCKRGGYIGAIADFRPTDFGIMPIAVDGGEPDQWLALRVAHEALADAGYSQPPAEHVRTEVVLGKGTYVNRGNLTVGYHGMIVEYFLQALKNLRPEYTEAEIDAIKKELKEGLPPFNADTAPALIGNIIAGRIANRMDFMGPSFTVDAACASALLAVEIGVRDLLSRKYDLVLAGGANVNAPLPTMSLFCQLGALSRKERIRPFDKEADGTILGEGVGMVVLKRLEDAEREGNRIYAVIKGVGVASDGRAVHVMAPRVEGEELALRRAYEMASVSPDTVGLIEAHGTATPLGDVVEVQALTRVFGERLSVLPTCALGSVKSMIGHTMPAAGIAGLIKTALALYHRVLPPTLNCEQPNPALNLEKTPFYVNTEARPWIHGADTPRRAGVNSFGFGGINAHAVLEEYPDERPGQRSHQLSWDSEVCVLEAPTREALIERARQLQSFLARRADVSIKDVAYTLNTGLTNQPSRIAFIAATTIELETKLSTAIARLSDPKYKQIKDNGGIYFFQEPLRGKLAFLFPGEGAQYPNMLIDLCMHFPEVRACFDLADRALKHGSRKVLPSDLIFPRSILSDQEKASIDQALWQIDGAVEGVLISNWAIWTLLNQLHIRPDVIAGHSTGDYSAMLASKIIQLPDEAYVKTILEWNKAHHRLSMEMPVPQATLVAVAADVDTVSAVAKEAGGDLHLAMDNCPHQAVLVGTTEATGRAIEIFRSRGIIYETLPFDRPYHTELFRAYAQGAGDQFFASLPIGAPQIETYSCTTAARYPTDIDGIRDLFVAHWVKPVLFTQTVRQMYDDGVRLFIEAGPRGNLTAFVSDILRGKPHLAMPSNLPRRSGITQINHLVGILAAQGVSMRTDYLYARRAPTRIEWDAEKPAKHTPAMKLSLELPPLKVSPRPAVAQRVELAPIAKPPVTMADNRPPVSRAYTVSAASGSALSSVPATAVAETPLAIGEPSELPAPTAKVAQPTPKTPVIAPQSPAASGKSLVMQHYLKSMESFLEVETQVMRAFLDRSRQPRIAPEQPVTKCPLLGEIIQFDAGHELVAIRTLNLTEDLFLLDHALGGRISADDPTLKPLMVMPLTMSMEMMAEAAAALIPNLVLVGMRKVRTTQWIQVDERPAKLRISARVLPGSGKEVWVEISKLTDSDGAAATHVVEGTLIFDDAYPDAPRAAVPRLHDERASRIADSDLYDGRVMFHGPCFQGVEHIARCGTNGIIGHLTVLPFSKMFRSFAAPRFITDPVLLDAAGQLVGYWTAEYLERGFVVFPYELEELRIFGPNRATGDLLTCNVQVSLQGADATNSRMEISRPDGGLYMTLKGWVDRRFDPPQAFHGAWTAPGEATMSEPWPSPLRHVLSREGLELYRLKPLFGSTAAFWKELWASLVLSRAERNIFQGLRSPERRQMEWLGGRTAGKDAVRTLLKKQRGISLLPADVEIHVDEHGRPSARGAWSASGQVAVELSISHSEGLAVALASDAGRVDGIGIDVQAFRTLEPNFVSVALMPQEQRLLAAITPNLQDEWLLRMWCAKEALSKALGRGLIEGPGSIELLAVDAETGAVRARPSGALADAVTDAHRLPTQIYTATEDGYIVAIALIEKKTS